ncbi:hypothetical protein C0995_008959 [Termitomyces sp. Mi166|nr:hypothetical protein C0995_008959 [Termitomyces sp. Mi166\
MYVFLAFIHPSALTSSLMESWQITSGTPRLKLLSIIKEQNHAGIPTGGMMWETAEKAGIITANLMWLVRYISYLPVQGLIYLQARASENLVWRELNVLHSLEGSRLATRKTQPNPQMDRSSGRIEAAAHHGWVQIPITTIIFWLRRTRPSQREYQVLISIDDSRSMAESHSVHLTYQTLALISKALNRLEAGDIAIAKFGETVDILHGFDEGPFTDQSGIKVMSAFRFDQKATNVLSLVETSLKVLENAREKRSMSSATVADLWQLQFIISDGMCQDHERLHTVLRKAEEQRVMIVFVIIDSLHSTVDNAPGGKGVQSGSQQGSILTYGQGGIQENSRTLIVGWNCS